MTLIEAKKKAINEITACKNDSFTIWSVFDKHFYIQWYIKEGSKKEHYGHIFEIDFINKKLVVKL